MVAACWCLDQSPDAPFVVQETKHQGSTRGVSTLWCHQYASVLNLAAFVLQAVLWSE